MSDFGSLLLIRKSNQEALTPNDFNQIKTLCIRLRASDQYHDFLDSPLEFSLVTDTQEAQVILSEFYFSGEDDEGEFEFAQDNDGELVEDLTREFQENLGDMYLVTSGFQAW